MIAGAFDRASIGLCELLWLALLIGHERLTANFGDRALDNVLYLLAQ